MTDTDSGTPPGFTELQVAYPHTGDGVPDLTPEQVRFMIANHAECIRGLADVIVQQQMSINLLLEGLAAYMIQYPLDAAEIVKRTHPQPEQEKVPIGAYL